MLWRYFSTVDFHPLKRGLKSMGTSTRKMNEKSIDIFERLPEILYSLQTKFVIFALESAESVGPRHARTFLLNCGRTARLVTVQRLS